MSTYLSVLFLVKRSKISSKGLCPIFMRLTISGKRLEFSIGRSIEPEKWCNESGKLKGRSADVRQVNNYLDLLKSRVYKIQQDLTFEKDILTVQVLKDKLFGVDQNKRMLLVIMKEHNDKMEKLIGNEYAKGTVIRYKSCYKHLQNFLKVNFNCADIEITKINLKFINEFEYYLRTKEDKPCSNNSAVKYIKNLGKIIRICLANEWLEKDPYIGYKSSYHEVHRKFLDEAELKRLETKIFKIDRIAVVRDIFVFSCYTGLSFVDIRNLTKDHIGVGVDGKKWIFTSRQKTKILSNIPLLSKAEDILNKYVDYPISSNSRKLLPVTSNQKMNSYLKEIADLCDIKKDLTFHIARHTFATTITLSNGVPIESVSKMLGHKSIKTTQIYAKIMDRKVGADMSNLEILLNSK